MRIVYSDKPAIVILPEDSHIQVDGLTTVRLLQTIGTALHTSLPKAWVQRFSLQRKDSVDLKWEPGSQEVGSSILILSTNKSPASYERKIIGE